jgi:hypothetical protein
VVRAALSLSPTQRGRTASGLRRILQKLSAERERPAPGMCTLCGHLANGGERGFRCRLLREPLAVTELEQLCVHCTECARV